MAARRFSREQLHAELGEIVNGTKPGRESATERIFFNAVGMGIEDVAFATAILRNAQSRGLGQRIKLWPGGPLVGLSG